LPAETRGLQAESPFAAQKNSIPEIRKSSYQYTNKQMIKWIIFHLN